MRRRIKALPRLVRLDVADQFRDRFRVARDKNLLLRLERLLRFGPSLTQITDTHRLHVSKVNMFHRLAEYYRFSRKKDVIEMEPNACQERNAITVDTFAKWFSPAHPRDR